MSTSIRDCLVIEMISEAQNEDYTATRPGDVVDVHLTSIAGMMGETITLQRQALGAGAFNAITGALACADALGTLARTALVAVAQDAVVATDVLRAAGSGATTRARTIIQFLPSPIT